MDNLYSLFSVQDKYFLKEFLGECSSYEVLNAYGVAFGSAQILAYEADTLDVVARDLLEADDETRCKFCAALEGREVSPDIVTARKTERKIIEKERTFRTECRRRVQLAEHDIAGSLRRQFGI